jgi:hypothetical protein
MLAGGVAPLARGRCNNLIYCICYGRKQLEDVLIALPEITALLNAEIPHAVSSARGLGTRLGTARHTLLAPSISSPAVLLRSTPTPLLPLASPSLRLSRAHCTQILPLPLASPIHFTPIQILLRDCATRSGPPCVSRRRKQWRI